MFSPIVRSNDSDDMEEIMRVATDAEPSTAKYYKTRVQNAVMTGPFVKSMFAMHENSNALKGMSQIQGFYENVVFNDDKTLSNFRNEDGSINYGNLLTPKKVSAKELNERYGIPGALTFTNDMSETAARLKYKQVSMDMQRQEVLSRYTHNNAVVDFGVDTVASMLDPINLGAMFIPVVGEERFAALGLNKVASRVAAGGVTGATAMAVLEPINYVLDNQLGYKHDVSDSVHNIMLGAAMGATLHTVFGGVNDLIAKKAVSVNAHKAATKAAVGQFLEGKEVNVNPILKADLVADDITVKKHEMLSSIGSEKELVNLQQGKHDFIDVKQKNAHIEKLTSKVDNLKKEYNKITDKEYSSNYIKEELRKNGYPVDVVDGYKQKINDLESQRNTLVENKTAGKGAKRIAQLDEKISETKAELEAIKKLNDEGKTRAAVDKLSNSKSVLRQKIKNLESEIEANKSLVELEEFRQSQTPEQIQNEVNTSIENDMSKVEPSRNKELDDVINTYKTPDDIEKLHSAIESDVNHIEQVAKSLTGDEKVFDKITKDYELNLQEIEKEEKGILSAIACIVNKEI